LSRQLCFEGRDLPVLCIVAFVAAQKKQTEKDLTHYTPHQSTVQGETSHGLLGCDKEICEPEKRRRIVLMAVHF
jgi:hypothetical protein